MRSVLRSRRRRAEPPENEHERNENGRRGRVQHGFDDRLLNVGAASGHVTDVWYWQLAASSAIWLVGSYWLVNRFID